MEVPLAEQQWQIGLDAGGGDDPVDCRSHHDPLAAQLSVVFRRLPGIAASQHRSQGQGYQVPLGLPRLAGEQGPVLRRHTARRCRQRPARLPTSAALGLWSDCVEAQRQPSQPRPCGGSLAEVIGQLSFRNCKEAIIGELLVF